MLNFKIIILKKNTIYLKWFLSATANYVEEIPRPMLDRVELIRINQYTSEEKVQIAKNHLVKEVITSNGLKEKEFIINQKSIEFIVDKYTAEAGVRGLNKVFR